MAQDSNVQQVQQKIGAGHAQAMLRAGGKELAKGSWPSPTPPSGRWKNRAWWAI